MATLKNIRYHKYWYTEETTIDKNLALVRAANGVFWAARIKHKGEVLLQVQFLFHFWPSLNSREGSKRYKTIRFSPKSRLNVPKIPIELILRAKSFFQVVQRIYDTEAMVQLLYSASDKCWDIRPASQLVSTFKVWHEDTEICPPGYVPIGVIHSHNTAHAYHSDEDDKAELPINGIYITIGKVDDLGLDISSSVVVNGMRIIVNSNFLIEDEFLPAFPDHWMSYVTYKKTDIKELSS